MSTLATGITNSLASLPALLQFNLRDIGIKPYQFMTETRESFDKLPIDVYEKRRRQMEFLKAHLPEMTPISGEFIAAYIYGKACLGEMDYLFSLLSPQKQIEFERVGDVRYRAIARFEIAFSESMILQMKRINVEPYVQNTPDIRSLPRHFSEASNQLVEHVSFKKLCRFIAWHVKHINGSVRKLIVTLHQVSVAVHIDSPFRLPDGIHQDGVDYIISAIPMILDNVEVPVSTVYDERGKTVMQTRLMIGDALFHDDRLYWHSVTDLCAKAQTGRRATLGFDIQIVE